MPIAISPEHNDLADSVRVPGGAGGAVGGASRGDRDAHPQPAAVLEGRCRAGSAGRAPGGIGRRTRFRNSRACHRVRRVRLRRGAWAVRAVGDRQRADLGQRPRRQGARRPGVRRSDRRLCDGVRPDRHPPGRHAWSSAARCARCPQRRRRRCWCCRSRAARDSGEEWVVLDADALEIEPVKSVDPLRPLAHVRANAVEVAGRPRAEQARRGVRARVGDHPAVRGGHRRRTLGHRHRLGVRQDPRAVRQAHRPIPGHQTQVRRDDRRHRAGYRGGMGRRPCDRRGFRQNTARTEAAFEFAAAVAATLAPVAAQHCTQDCIQVHGGIGFTWEHDTNVYYRRAIMLAACFGRAADYPQQVVDIATSPGCARSTSTSILRPRSCAAEIRAEIAALKAIPT